MGSAPNNEKKLSQRGSASEQFPGKLHDLMTYIEQEGLCDIISWVQNGKAIMVHDPERLLKILPHVGFSQTKYRSFQRQLNMWHWERILNGPCKGAWIHPYFIQGNKVLCSFMSRHSLPKPEMIRVLLSAAEITVESNNAISLPTKLHSEKLQFPLMRGNTSTPFSAPLKSYSKSVDEWEPLPTTCQENQTLFDEQFLHFMIEPEPVDATPFPTPFPYSESMYEPVPIPTPDKTGMNQLLEPLSADAIEELF
jgi:hypothetical protein